MPIILMEHVANKCGSQLKKVKRMLGQRLETSLKSQTLPRLDGQDEEAEVLEHQFEILSIANSCPDLTVLEIENLGEQTRISPVTTSSGVDVVDGIFFKNPAAVKIPASFRRSTSLSSLGVDGNQREIGTDENVVSVLQPGPVSKAVNQLQKNLKKEGVGQQCSNDFIRTNLRASHGCTSGYLHKSISSPSVTQYFVGVAGGLAETYHKPHHRVVQSDAHQHSTKRSFFRRKHKSKGNSVNLHHPTVPPCVNNNNKMDGTSNKAISSINGDLAQSFGFVGLNDPSLGLQDSDAECWALSMSPEVVSRLDDKEVKRQEHMYELILTEKHHCLTLALMQHLFVGGMKKAGFHRQARLLFPDLNKLLEVHFSFLRRMRERQLKFREIGEPMDTLTDILIEQFTGNQWELMIRLYGLLCASHAKSLEMFKSLLKDQKFASLVAAWDKEPLLSRKNVRECLLLVAQRITKYPLLFEPIWKTTVSEQERELILKSFSSSKELISKVNERVAERQRLIEICLKIDPKSYAVVGQRRRSREDIMSVPSRRLLFHGQAILNCNRNSNTSGGATSAKNVPCTVLILTDSLIFTQEFSGRLQFVSPPGVVMLNNLIVRPNAGQNSSLFLVLGTGTATPEIIDLQVTNPSDRGVWMGKIRDAMTAYQNETETCSDGDEEAIDASDMSDVKTTKALEELQEQDKQLLSSLRSRARLIDGLRLEKPHHWISNSFDGKDGLLNALTAACTEVQRVMNLWESNANSCVNRSSSCAGEHGSQGALLGLPKRADTFGGFDSQQRSALELPQSTNSKLLFEIVVHLSDLCGEMFSQMVPQLMPSVYQSHHQLQRRMEDLREAQQRLETEKALWQQELSVQKETIERERSELATLKNSLQKEQADIVQQREQLYRKLEALQKQGIRPPLDPISPLSGTATAEKVPTHSVPARRQVAQPPPTTSSVPANSNQAVNGVKNKQQLPLFLAASSSFKASKSSLNPSNQDSTSSILRGSLMASFKGNSSSNVTQNSPQSSNNDTSGVNLNSRPPVQGRSSSTQPPTVQQLLPLRLSEGNASKTSSLPRGVGSRSVSSMMSQMDQSQQSKGHLRTSVSTSQFSHQVGNVNPTGDSLSQPNSSFLYGPVHGMRKQSYTDSQQNKPNQNGYNDNYHGSTSNPQYEGVPIVHRRSGSSPVPMSSVPARRQPASEILSHVHPFFQPRDDDTESKILFL